MMAALGHFSPCHFVGRLPVDHTVTHRVLLQQRDQPVKQVSPICHDGFPKCLCAHGGSGPFEDTRMIAAPAPCSAAEGLLPLAGWGAYYKGRTGSGTPAATPGLAAALCSP